MIQVQTAPNTFIRSPKNTLFMGSKGTIAALTIIFLIILAAAAVYFLTAKNPSAAPTYSSVSASSTVAGSSCKFSALWNDDANVSGYIFGTNNTGVFTNDTWTPFTAPQFLNSTAAYSNITKTLNDTIGNTVQWKIWCNDTNNNWNSIYYQNLLVDTNKVRLQTSMGNMTILLYQDMPITTGNFKNLVRRELYDGTIFHRVVYNFVIQGGNVTNVSTIQDELPTLHNNTQYTVAMAKSVDSVSG